MSSTRKNILANYLGQGWSALMAVAFLPLYIRYLGVEAYGLIGLFAVVQALMLVIDMGIAPALNREMARFSAGLSDVRYIRDLLRSLEIICFGFAALMTVVAWAFSDYLARGWLNSVHLSPLSVAHALILMTLVAGLRLCESLYRGCLYGLEHQVWFNAASTILTTLRYLGALGVLVFFSPTLQAFFVWQAILSVLTLLLFSWRVYISLPEIVWRSRFSTKALAEIGSFAGGMIGIACVTMLFLQIDKIILSRFFSLKDLGYYSLAATAANIIFIIAIPVTQAIYPRLVRISSGVDEIERNALYRKTMQLTAVLLGSASMLLCFFSSGVIYMWSGSAELVSATAPLLSILVLGSFLNGLAYLPGQLQIASGSPQRLLLISTFVLIIFVILVIYLTPIFGLKGAAWAWLVGNTVYLGLIHATAPYPSGKRLKSIWFSADVMLPTIASVVVMLVGIQLQPSGFSDRLRWASFLVVTGLFALAISTMTTSLLRQQVVGLLRAKSIK
ncbi:MAG: oligosaccharide flippase family protein [Pseudomonadota bacterium]